MSRSPRTQMQYATPAYGVRTGTDLQKGIRLKRREFIMNVGHNAVGARGAAMFRPIRSSSNGVLTSIAEIAVNVGLGKFFPWLSNVAQFFDKFILHQCRFEYVPSTGSTTQGTVALCPTYKSDESTVGATKVDLLDRAGSSRSACWQSNSCKLDAAKLTAAYASHYVRTGEVTDRKLFDPARLDMLLETPASGDGVNDDVGELWVEYDVGLEVPKGMTDNRTGSYCTMRIAGVGAAKTVTFDSKTEDSSVLDFDNFWIEPDASGLSFYVHIPFKKATKILLTYNGPVTEGTGYAITSSTYTSFTCASTTRFVGEVAIVCGYDDNGKYNAELLHQGLRVHIPMADLTEIFKLYATEIGDTTYQSISFTPDHLETDKDSDTTSLSDDPRDVVFVPRQMKRKQRG